MSNLSILSLLNGDQKNGPNVIRRLSGLLNMQGNSVENAFISDSLRPSSAYSREWEHNPNTPFTNSIMTTNFKNEDRWIQLEWENSDGCR